MVAWFQVKQVTAGCCAEAPHNLSGLLGLSLRYNSLSELRAGQFTGLMQLTWLYPFLLCNLQPAALGLAADQPHRPSFRRTRTCTPGFRTVNWVWSLSASGEQGLFFSL